MHTGVSEWYATALQDLLARKDKLPHALLLTGAQGIGKQQFVDTMAAALLCRQSSTATADSTACGQCQSCQLFKAGTHPDLYRISLPLNEDGKPAKEIKVDQIRRLAQALAQTSQFGGNKIAIIDPADKMNRNAANSLLKTLEEPGADTVLILITAYPQRLLPTVRSRCQKLQLKTPGRATVINWLRQQFPDRNPEQLYAAAGGTPFAALNLVESNALEVRNTLFSDFRDVALKHKNPLNSAADWTRCEPDLAFRWLRSWLQDIVALASGTENHELLNTDLQKDLHVLASRIDLPRLYQFYDRLQQSEFFAQGSANRQLLFESLLLEWSQHCSAGH